MEGIADEERRRNPTYIGPSLRVAPMRHRGPSAALRLLGDGLRCIACVAAPCIQPGHASNAVRADIRIGSKSAREE